MSSDRIIVDALRLAHGLVWQNLRPTTDAATVSQLRDLVHSPSVRSALERSSDTLPAFALREVARAALKDACAQLLQGHVVNRIVGPNETTNAERVKDWCAKHQPFKTQSQN
jgi:hypothetical protein